MKSHRERAALAADHVLALIDLRETAKDKVYASDLTPRIARDTFPTELVKAAEMALGYADTRDMLYSDRGAQDLAGVLRSALAAYEETP